MKKLMLTAVLVAMVAGVQAAIIYTDNFDAATIDTQWNNNLNTAATLDTVNEEIDWAHTAGLNKRFLSYNPSVLNGSNLGYFKADISNYVSGKTRMSFVGDNSGNSNHYAYQTVEGGNGKYELFINTTASAEAWNNGAGQSGILAAGTGVFVKDNGAPTALTFGSSFTTTQTIRGFGFHEFANTTVFPTAAFSIDNVVVANSLTIPEPATFGLFAIAGGAMIAIRRKMIS